MGSVKIGALRESVSLSCQFWHEMMLPDVLALVLLRRYGKSG